MTFLFCIDKVLCILTALHFFIKLDTNDSHRYP